MKDNEYYPEICLDECSYLNINMLPRKFFFCKNII